MKREETITNKWVASKAGWTPYDGVKVKGWPVGTFVRGKRVMWQGEVMTPSTGEPVRFLETLKPETRESQIFPLAIIDNSAMRAAAS
jgi:dihydroorotase